MLSFSRGKPIAKLYKMEKATDGKKKVPKIPNKPEKTISIYGEDDFGKNKISDITIPKSENGELLDLDFFKDNKIPKSKRDTVRDIVSGKQSNYKMSEEMTGFVEEAELFIAETLKTKLDVGDEENMRCFPIPQKLSERIYVPAPSGSGKSTFIGMYLSQLREKHPKRSIYIFSRVEEDAPLDAFKNTFRIPLQRATFEKEPLEIEKFKNGILIFDDIDTILDKPLVKYIRNFRDDVLETGRHYDITIISTSHIITNFMATRTLINEANAIVLFPKGSSFYAVSNFLERYMGFNRKQIRQVEKLDSRWIWLWKEYPKYAIYERGVFIF
tara:strand:+ start:5433 stop:6416 length:984 start_codon:yes stop_codon:yes gene_type:complete